MFHRRNLRLAQTTAVVALCFPLTVLSQTYKFHSFNIPGSIFTEITGINDSGSVVGEFVTANNKHYGFLLEGKKFTFLDPFGAAVVDVFGINNASQIVGGYIGSDSKNHGFMYSAGTFQTIDVPQADYTQVNGINDYGELSGQFGDATGNHGFTFSNGIFAQLDFPTASSTYAWGVNNSGLIAGFYADSAQNLHGFTFQDGSYTAIDCPGFQVQANGVSNSGNVIVTASSGGVGYAFIASQGCSSKIMVPKTAFTNGLGINAKGLVVGGFDAGDQTYGYFAVPVPK